MSTAPWLALLGVVVVLYVPALVVIAGLRGGLRPVDVVAAPGVSVLVVSVAGLALAQLGRGAAPAAVAALVVGVAGVGLLVRFVMDRASARGAIAPEATGATEAQAVPAPPAPPAPPAHRARDAWRRRDLVPAVVGVVVAALVGLTFWIGPQWLDGVPNTVDSIWHGYTTALLVDGTPASPFSLVPVDPFLATPTTPYPYGFHLVAALSAGAAGIVPAVNAVLYVGSIVVGPIGAAGAARVLFPRTPLAALLAPILLQSIVMWQVRVQAQPPYALGMALLPGGIALVAAALRRNWSPPLVATAVAYGAGMLVVHPASAVSLAVVVVPLVVVDLVGRLRRGARPNLRSLPRAWPVVVTGLLVLPWVLRSLSSADLALAVPRVLVVTFWTGVREAVLITETVVATGQVVAAPLWLVALLLVSLVLLAVRGPARWLVVSWLLMLALTVVAASGSGQLRLTLTGPWFMDAHRMWSVLAVINALVMAGAVAGVVARLRGALPERARPWGAAGLAGLLVVAVASVVALESPGYREQTALAKGDLLVTPSERTAFGWLRENVPAGERVLNNWRDGSTWGFTLEGNPVVIPYLSTLVEMRERARMFYNLDKLGSDERVDRQVVDLNARWAIVDDTQLPGGKPATSWFPADSPYAEVAFQVGGTTIYRLDLEALRATLG